MFLNKFLKRVIACPSCGQRSRVPIKPGKVLRVNCPNCKNIFEIKFEPAIKNLKSINKQTLLQGFQTYRRWPWHKRMISVLCVLSVFLLLRTCVQSEPARHLPHKVMPPTQLDTEDSILSI